MKPTFYNNGSVLRIEVEFPNLGQVVVKYYDTTTNKEIDPFTTVLSLDFPQPVFRDDSYCCNCATKTCRLAKVLDSYIVEQEANLYGWDLSVEMEYLSVNGTVVLENQPFFMAASEIQYTDFPDGQIYNNLFLWLKGIFSAYGISLRLGATMNDGMLYDTVEFSYDTCEVQSFEFKMALQRGEDIISFDTYTLNQDGYSEVNGFENQSFIDYVKISQSCI